jgi:hypothetical protein
MAATNVAQRKAQRLARAIAIIRRRYGQAAIRWGCEVRP